MLVRNKAKAARQLRQLLSHRGCSNSTRRQVNRLTLKLISKTKKKEVVGAYRLPWREWRGGAGCALMGQKTADMASAVAVMQHLHGSFPVEDEPIDMMYREGVGPYVITNDDIAENVIKIPPCVPKQAKVFERSEHPQAVMITVTTMEKPYIIADESKQTKTPAAAAVPKAASKKGDAAKRNGATTAVAGSKQKASADENNGSGSTSN